ncbi:sensor histidine kinase [Lactococcus lactis RTB018]|uniref:sensor histidine kinase n=1 Tax=Lactococcus lactis TaxID=1358 RepID=UPI0007ECC563|nr:ATP-binding protein [Lactococcus lactis]MCT0051916.1 sensor histidine kinase [Lactococcus lactis subsp. lactis]OAZ16158.1 sensor histidine kinase [Lactococcus lactis RTB018]
MAKIKEKRKRKISVKIGGSFLAVVVAIELGLFISLYLLIVNTWVREEVDSVVAQGQNHALVLSGDFSAETIEHVVLMEEGSSQTAIVVQDPYGKTLKSSQIINSQMKKHISALQNEKKNKKESLHFHWLGDKYIVSKSRIQSNGKIVGSVYMFLSTRPIQKMVFNFTGIFAVLAVITLIVTAFSIFYITRTVTRPLLKIKLGTDKIAQGDLSIQLNVNTEDELGELAKSIEDLAEKLDFMKRERNEFLSSVAHELRTPLTFIKGYADIAHRSSTSPEDSARYLSIIREESQRLTQLMEELMNLAQLEENEFKIEKNQVLIQELTSEVVSKVSGVFGEKKIKFLVSGEGKFYANIDFTRIEQVLVNLLMNSYKYSAEGSDIKLTVIPKKENFKIVIADKGEGIPEQDLPYIFERFYRVDKSRTRTTGGVGLGLAIVQDIVKKHNGKIIVESIQNQGTTFIIELPYS